MKLYTSVYLILLTLFFIVDFLMYNIVKYRIKIQKILHWLPGLIFIVYFSLLKLWIDEISDYRILLLVMWINLVFLSIYISKLLYIFVLMAAKKLNWNKKSTIISSTILIFSFLVFVVYGSAVAPLSTETTKTVVHLNALPNSFDNYTIVQISDVHLGSRINGASFYRKVVDEINSLQPDIVVFTGDMVNNFAAETGRADSIFSKIKAKDGMFAVLGNHDYGDYSVWKNDKDKQKNFDNIKLAIKSFGFDLLTNDHRFLKKGTDSIALVGVENFSKKDYINYAQLQKAVARLEQKTFKLLLSHNPDHWESEVLPLTNISLTLSGHTHASQLGLNINGTVYSPAVFLYKQYNGIFEKNDRYIYVSRGIGYIGLPLIVGLKPEISVVVLKCKK